MIDLNHINLSTDTDKEFQLDAWVKFFTAKTWEEVYYKQKHTTEKLLNDITAERDKALFERSIAINERDSALTRIAELEAQLAQQNISN